MKTVSEVQRLHSRMDQLVDQLGDQFGDGMVAQALVTKAYAVPIQIAPDVPVIQIFDAVLIKRDGSIEYLDGFTTNDGAARLFWEAVNRLRPKAFRMI